MILSFTRIYQNIPLVTGKEVELDEAASHHLARVLRKKIDDDIILFNGLGSEFQARITKITKKTLSVIILSEKPINREASLDIYLAQGIARGEKMDFILQKAVELGVKKIFPLITERCQGRMNQEREEKRLRHFQSVIVSAAEQSGRNILPELLAPESFDSFLNHAEADVKLILSPHTEKKFVPENFSHPKSILLLVGPEGGLTDKEVAMAEKENFLAVQLGNRILRTETASIAGIVALLSWFNAF